MILNLNEENISFLFNAPVPVMEDIGKVIAEYLSEGGNPNLSVRLAQKLGISKETIQNGVEELVYLFVENYKRKVNCSDFRDFALKTGFSDKQADILRAVYEEQKVYMLEILQESSKSQFPHFSDLEWRFESQIASRSLLHQNDPSVLIKLKTFEGSVPQNHFLVIEPTVLLNITNKLKEALKESNSVISKRVVKKFSSAS